MYRFLQLVIIIGGWAASVNLVAQSEDAAPQEESRQMLPTEEGRAAEGVQGAAEESRPTAAQTGFVKLRLRVLAKGTGRALKRAEIKIGNEKQYTNKDGEIEIDVPASLDQVEISRYGYEKLTLKKEQFLSGATWQEIFLYPGTPNDNEVLIRGIKRPEVSRKSISVDEASRIAPGGDPVQITRMLPGVQASTFSPQIVVRGSGPTDSNYYIDDIMIPEIFHRIGNIAVLPDNLTSDVEFSTGGFGAQKGDAHGGVVILRTTSEIPEHPKYEFRVNLPLYSSFFHERPIGEDQSIAVSLRQSYIDLFVKEFAEDGSLTVTPRFGDAHVRHLKKTETGYRKTLAMLSYDSLKLAAPIDAAASEDGRGQFNTITTYALLGYEWFESLGDGWSASITPNILLNREDTQILDNYLKTDIDAYRVHGELRKRRSREESIYIGAEYSLLKSDIKILAPIPDQDDPFYDFEEAPKAEINRPIDFVEYAAWFSIDQAIGPVILTPGVRGYYNDQIDTYGVDPRLGLRSQITKQHAIKAAVGLYSQSPERVEANEEFGNTDLKYEESTHVIVGYEWKPSNLFTAELQAFRKRTIHLITGDTEQRYVGTGDRKTDGIEVFLRRNPTEKLFAWLAYTYSKSLERDNAQEDYHQGQYDQTHVVNLAGSYRITGQWDLGMRIAYHTGDTYTPVADAVYNANLDKYQPRNADVELFSSRLPDYHQSDIYGTYDFLYDRWKLKLKFGVQFLSVEPQAINVQYNYDYSKEEYFTELPPIPYLELRGVF